MKGRDKTIEETLQKHLSLSADTPLTEPNVIYALSAAVPSEHLLFLGNSMPIRDFEMFAQPRAAAPRVLANRGASGIDGVLSTALGATSAAGQAGTFIVGDLSFLHDLNALALAKERTTPFVVVVINNDGGGIFSLLPVSGTSGFERCFGTPHGISFEGIVTGFGLSYAHPQTIGDLHAAYATALTHNGTTVIEVRTSREENAVLHRDIHQTIASVLK
jgi:2-succinyl-5-enolpyruvyl-6-hydroxy-3-cyclohexene-1-carboxylate synthase